MKTAFLGCFLGLRARCPHRNAGISVSRGGNRRKFNLAHPTAATALAPCRASSPSGPARVVHPNVPDAQEHPPPGPDQAAGHLAAVSLNSSNRDRKPVKMLRRMSRNRLQAMALIAS